jgi:hypothetical protein
MFIDSAIEPSLPILDSENGLQSKSLHERSGGAIIDLTATPRIRSVYNTLGKFIN